MDDSSPTIELHLKDAVSGDAQDTSTQEHALITLLSGQTQRRYMYPLCVHAKFRQSRLARGGDRKPNRSRLHGR